MIAPLEWHHQYGDVGRSQLQSPHRKSTTVKIPEPRGEAEEASWITGTEKYCIRRKEGRLHCIGLLQACTSLPQEGPLELQFPQ